LFGLLAMQESASLLIPCNPRSTDLLATHSFSIGKAFRQNNSFCFCQRFVTADIEIGALFARQMPLKKNKAGLV
jgi:hypothetical protein